MKINIAVIDSVHIFLSLDYIMPYEERGVEWLFVPYGTFFDDNGEAGASVFRKVSNESTYEDEEDYFVDTIYRTSWAKKSNTYNPPLYYENVYGIVRNKHLSIDFKWEFENETD